MFLGVLFDKLKVCRSMQYIELERLDDQLSRSSLATRPTSLISPPIYFLTALRPLKKPYLLPSSMHYPNPPSTINAASGSPQAASPPYILLSFPSSRTMHPPTQPLTSSPPYHSSPPKQSRQQKRWEPQQEYPSHLFLAQVFLRAACVESWLMCARELALQKTALWRPGARPCELKKPPRY